MDLNRWLTTDNNGGEDVLAKRCRTSQSTINRLRNKRRKAGLALALRIEAATDGQVRAEDLPMTRKTRESLRILRATQTPAHPLAPLMGDAA